MFVNIFQIFSNFIRFPILFLFFICFTGKSVQFTDEFHNGIANFFSDETLFTFSDYEKTSLLIFDKRIDKLYTQNLSDILVYDNDRYLFKLIPTSYDMNYVPPFLISYLKTTTLPKIPNIKENIKENPSNVTESFTNLGGSIFSGPFIFLLHSNEKLCIDLSKEDLFGICSPSNNAPTQFYLILSYNSLNLNELLNFNEQNIENTKNTKNKEKSFYICSSVFCLRKVKNDIKLGVVSDISDILFDNSYKFFLNKKVEFLNEKDLIVKEHELLNMSYDLNRLKNHQMPYEGILRHRKRTLNLFGDENFNNFNEREILHKNINPRNNVFENFKREKIVLNELKNEEIAENIFKERNSERFNNKILQEKLYGKMRLIDSIL